MSIGLIERFNEEQVARSQRLKLVAPGNVQAALLSQEPFAVRVDQESRQITPGVNLSTKSLDLPGDAFTNSYDLSFSQKDPSLSVRIDSSPRPYSLRRRLINDRSIVATINGGFFFLADMYDFMPKEFSFNLCVRDNQVVGLPCVDRPAIIVQDGQISTHDLKASGSLSIGNNNVDWVGAKSQLANSSSEAATLFNSACCEIKHCSSDKTGEKRVLVTDKNFTPSVKHGFDLVVSRDDRGLVLQDINPEGGTNYFSGSFVLQFRNGDSSRYKVGDPVHINTIDGIEAVKIDSAITIGPSVKNQNLDTDEINSDPSLGSHPPFVDRSLARSIVYKTMDGDIHFRIFDGAPKTKFFKGLTPKQLSEALSLEDAEWAYNLDPGQSARLAVREKEGIGLYGNSHYMRWPRSEHTTFLWSATGRLIPSSLSLYKVGDT